MNILLSSAVYCIVYLCTFIIKSLSGDYDAIPRGWIDLGNWIMLVCLTMFPTNHGGEVACPARVTSNIPAHCSHVLNSVFTFGHAVSFHSFQWFSTARADEEVFPKNLSLLLYSPPPAFIKLCFDYLSLDVRHASRSYF